MDEKLIPVKITYDKDSDAAYIYFASIDEGEVAETVPYDDLPTQGDVNLDFDTHGKLRGVEVLGASKVLPAELLKKIQDNP